VGHSRSRAKSSEQLPRITESHLRQIRIERLLLETNDLGRFTRQLRPLNEQMPQWENTVAVLIAAITGRVLVDLHHRLPISAVWGIGAKKWWTGTQRVDLATPAMSLPTTASIL
jgi:hypothetical protein